MIIINCVVLSARAAGRLLWWVVWILSLLDDISSGIDNKSQWSLLRGLGAASRQAANQWRGLWWLGVHEQQTHTAWPLPHTSLQAGHVHLNLRCKFIMRLSNIHTDVITCDDAAGALPWTQHNFYFDNPHRKWRRAIRAWRLHWKLNIYAHAMLDT